MGGRNRVEPGLRASINNLELDLDMVLLTNFDTDLVPAAACHIRNKPGRAAITVDELSFVLRIAVEDSLVGPALGNLTPEEVVIDLGAGGQLSAVALDITACDGLTPGDEACADPVCDSPDAECPDLCGNPRPCWRTQRPTLECFPTGFR